jgi:plasmid maintenance system antidote protein VapI
MDREITEEEYKAATGDFKPDWASPPGNTIKDILVEEEMSKEEFAEEMNLSIDQATDLLEGRARITLATARRLNLVFSGGVEFWMRRDLQYRESLATARGAKWVVCCNNLIRVVLNPHVVYVVPIKVGVRITEHLGAIKLRADGRWDWWRWSSDFHKEWSGHAQGVVGAKADAITIVEEGWL